MIIFRRIKDKLCLAKDKYEPTYIIEMCKIGLGDIMKLVELEKFDLLFIIMMFKCPEEVRVELELSENAFKDLQQCRPGIISKIQDTLDHKWIESEKVHSDLSDTTLIDRILKYDSN